MIGSIEAMAQAEKDLQHGKKVKKTRKLGKWVNGVDGRLTPEYAARRRKARKAARKSRARNRR